MAAASAATVSAVDAERVYGGGDRVYLSGDGFSPNEPIRAASFVPIRADRTTYPYDLVGSSSTLVVDGNGNLSGYVEIPSFPADVKWLQVALFATESNVAGSQWLSVTGGVASRAAKAASFGNILIDDTDVSANNDNIADTSERIDFQAGSSGWSGSILAIAQREYADSTDAQSAYLTNTSLSTANASISGGAVTGYVTTTGSFNSSATSLRMFVLNDSFESNYSNAMLVPDTIDPTISSVYATDLSTVVVNFSESITTPSGGSSEDNWTVGGNAVSSVSPSGSAGTTSITLTLSVALTDRGATPTVAFTQAASEYVDGGGNILKTTSPTAADSIAPNTITFDDLTVNTLVGSSGAYTLRATVASGTDNSLDGIEFEGSNDGTSWTSIGTATSPSVGVSASTSWDVTVGGNRYKMVRARAFDDAGSGGANNTLDADDNVSLVSVGASSGATDLTTAFRVEITSSAETVTTSAGGSSGTSAAITYQVVNRYGIAAAIYHGIDVSWTLSSTSSDGKFWSDDGATSSITFDELGGTGNTSTTIYYTDEVAGTPTITISRTAASPFTGTADASNSVNQAQTINAGTATKLHVIVPGVTLAPGDPDGKTGSPTDQTAGQDLTGVVTVYAVDDYFNVSNVGSDVNVNLTSNPATSTIDDLNGATTGNATISSGSNSVEFAATNISFTNATPYTLTAADQASGLTSSSSSTITVNAGTASKLLVRMPGQSFVNGVGMTGTPTTRIAGTSFTITLYAVDASNNVVATEDAARDIDFASTAGASPGGTNPTIDGVLSASWANRSISFTDGISASITVVFYDAATGVTITASDNSGSPTLTGTESDGADVDHGDLDSFNVQLTSTMEQNVNFTGTNTVSPHDAYLNVLTDFDASATNVTLSITVGGGSVEVASRGDGVLDQAGDFSSGIADLTSLGFKVTSGGAGSKTIQATDGSAHTGSDAVDITVTAPVVSSPSPSTDTQISSGASSQLFSATLTETNTSGSYKLYWRSGSALTDSSGLAQDSLSVSVGGGTISATMGTTQLSALSGDDYLFWWFDGQDAAGNDLTGSFSSGARGRIVVDPTVTLSGTQLITGLTPGQADVFASIEAAGEMQGLSVTITGLRFTKSGDATNALIDSVSLYLDSNLDNVAAPSEWLAGITIDNDTKLNSPNFTGLSGVSVTNTNTTRLLFVIGVNSSATATNNIGYRIDSSSDVTLGQSVADAGGTFPVPNTVNDAPLPVELASFTAHGTATGVTIEWVTESELENAGFYVLRALAPEGPFERYSDFIPGNGTTPSRTEYRFVDRNFVAGATAYYMLEQHDYDGTVSRESGIVSVTMLAPTAFALHPNAPNPFNPATTVMFDVPRATNVSIVVYDVTGRMVKELVSGAMSPGIHRAVWNGTDANGRAVASGLYVLRMMADGGEFQQIQRATLLR